MRLHMVSCIITGLVGKLVTEGAVELLVSWVLPYKLKEFTWVLECIAWYRRNITLVGEFYVYASAEQL